MLLQSYWLPSLIFALSATAHDHPPKPHHTTSTSTGTTLPSSTPAPYPTSRTNTTSSATTSLSSSAQPPLSTGTSTPSGSFYLVVSSSTNSSLNGQYVYLESDTSGSGLLVLYLRSAPTEVTSFSTFSLNADGTLQNQFAAGVASIFPGGTYAPLMFTSEIQADQAGYPKSICHIGSGGVLICQTGADSVFSVCPYQTISGTLVGGTVDVGPTAHSGCTTVTLKVVPI